VLALTPLILGLAEPRTTARNTQRRTVVQKKSKKLFNKGYRKKLWKGKSNLIRLDTISASFWYRNKAFNNSW